MDMQEFTGRRPANSPVPFRGWEGSWRRPNSSQCKLPLVSVRLGLLSGYSFNLVSEFAGQKTIALIRNAFEFRIDYFLPINDLGDAWFP